VNEKVKKLGATATFFAILPRNDQTNEIDSPKHEDNIRVSVFYAIHERYLRSVGSTNAGGF
jgi:hypothetical protein